jgi:hypothetical protein
LCDLAHFHASTPYLIEVLGSRNKHLSVRFEEGFYPNSESSQSMASGLQRVLRRQVMPSGEGLDRNSPARGSVSDVETKSREYQIEDLEASFRAATEKHQRQLQKRRRGAWIILAVLGVVASVAIISIRHNGQSGEIRQQMPVQQEMRPSVLLKGPSPATSTSSASVDTRVPSKPPVAQHSASSTVEQPTPANSNKNSQAATDHASTDKVASPHSVSPSYLTIRAEHELGSWVDVCTGGKEVVRQFLPQQQSVKVAFSDNVVIRLGNAGGVEISVNGVPMRPLDIVGKPKVARYSAGAFHLLKPGEPGSECGR